jgi:cytochrome c-type biogenesis protein CcmH|tara:strand:- start:241 stop:1170 length:930 start_codon:yes stop_codon:yes gene_type:complete
MKKFVIDIFILFKIVIFVSTINTVFADDQKQYNKIIENLRCLVCQNQSLSESDSNLAKDLRNKVKEMLESGNSEDEIYKFMSDRYTDYVLYNPPLKKSTWFLWYSPFIILIFSLSYMFVFFKRKNSKNFDTKEVNDNKKNLDLFIEKRSIDKKYIYIFLFILIPLTTLSIYSYSSEYMRYKISYYFASKKPIIDITVTIHDDILNKITGNEILFVYARRSNGMRVPLAIDIFEVEKFKKNYNITLNNTMNMIENQTLSLAKEIIVEARISKNKKAMTVPGDFIGISKPITLKSSNYLLLNINSIVTEEK